MASADLKRIMLFQGRRGPTGKLWLEADRAGRRFVLFEGKNGWTLFERINPGLSDPGERGARPSAPPRPPPRMAPKRLRRELVGLGLIEASDLIEEMAP